MSKSFLVVLYTYNNNNSVLYTNNTCVNGDHSSNQRPMAACIDNFMVKAYDSTLLYSDGGDCSSFGASGRVVPEVGCFSW